MWGLDPGVSVASGLVHPNLQGHPQPLFLTARRARGSGVKGGLGMNPPSPFFADWKAEALSGVGNCPKSLSRSVVGPVAAACPPPPYLAWAESESAQASAGVWCFQGRGLGSAW